MTESKKPDQKLNAQLDHYDISPASDLLSARILKVAKATPQETQISQKSKSRFFAANDTNKTPWTRIAAACVIVMGLGIGALVSQNQTISPTEDTVWQEAAYDLGVSDIYAWVEDDEVSTEKTDS